MAFVKVLEQVLFQALPGPEAPPPARQDRFPGTPEDDPPRQEQVQQQEVQADRPLHKQESHLPSCLCNYWRRQGRGPGHLNRAHKVWCSSWTQELRCRLLHWLAHRTSHIEEVWPGPDDQR